MSSLFLGKPNKKISDFIRKTHLKSYSTLPNGQGTVYLLKKTYPKYRLSAIEGTDNMVAVKDVGVTLYNVHEYEGQVVEADNLDGIVGKQKFSPKFSELSCFGTEEYEDIKCIKDSELEMLVNNKYNYHLAQMSDQIITQQSEKYLIPISYTCMRVVSIKYKLLNVEDFDDKIIFHYKNAMTIEPSPEMQFVLYKNYQ